MKTTALMIGLAMLATPVSAATMPPQAEIDAAKARIISILFDPAPVFPDVVVVDAGGYNIYCGYVNARNRMGGYSGAKPFIVISTISAEVVDDDPRTSGFERKVGILRGYCMKDQHPVKVQF